MTDSSIPPMRRCTKCGVEFPATLEFFTHQKGGKYGLSSWCRACKSEYYKSDKRRAYNRASYQANKDRYKEKQRVYAEAHREEARQRTSDYRKQNRERVLEYNRDYRKKNYDIQYGKNLEWRHENADRVRLYTQKRNSQKKSLPVDFTPDDLAFAKEYWKGLCPYCGRQAVTLFDTFHCDHFIPLSSPKCPGTLAWNMLPGCRHCNQVKHKADPYVWIAKEFGKRKAKQILARIEEYFAVVKQRKGIPE